MPANSDKVRIVTLGCAKNEVDSEEIAGVLGKAGYTIDGTSAEADVIVINTCGFLESAKDESIATIRAAVAEKEAGRASKVIVAGCLAQRMGAELMRLAPGGPGAPISRSPRAATTAAPSAPSPRSGARTRASRSSASSPKRSTSPSRARGRSTSSPRTSPSTASTCTRRSPCLSS
ncbi:hypothetical protein EON82_10520 [bacterium]|nr:MAG: hypothetical protein EON82_10520 [bacterium]